MCFVSLCTPCRVGTDGTAFSLKEVKTDMLTGVGSHISLFQHIAILSQVEQCRGIRYGSLLTLVWSAKG